MTAGQADAHRETLTTNPVRTPRITADYVVAHSVASMIIPSDAHQGVCQEIWSRQATTFWTRIARPILARVRPSWPASRVAKPRWTTWLAVQAGLVVLMLFPGIPPEESLDAGFRGVPVAFGVPICLCPVGFSDIDALSGLA